MFQVEIHLMEVMIEVQIVVVSAAYIYNCQWIGSRIYSRRMLV